MGNRPGHPGSAPSCVPGAVARVLTRVDELGCGEPPERTRRFFCPCMNGLAPEHAALVALLPIHDVNELLLRGVAECPSWPRATYACVLAMDPFRSTHAMLRTLARHGVTRVCNYPSVVALEPTLYEALDEFALSVQREVAFVRDASQAGFRVAARAESVHGAHEMLCAGAAALWVPGSLMDVSGDLLCEAAARRGTEIIVDAVMP